MSELNSSYIISPEMRALLMQQIGEMKKENVQLQQSLREQKIQNTSQTEDLFLELLEVADALEALLLYLENNSQPSSEFIQRLPRSVAAVNRKFLNVLGKRQLQPIQLTSQEPDFNLCRVVDQEETSDVPDQTITKVVRRGFRWGDKILRPTEVITAKAKSPTPEDSDDSDDNNDNINQTLNQNTEEIKIQE
ncbi:MAG: nucleotide exchange factor GrpE [Sphaerospermopsis sp. SIO1G2]|nr:nucleotide exchange factor GrpE [Sphaerospermopsis sp. SIO1G1]NET69932.1 nucleotide exchange factor GrpE [Sphaerospermopsis sp. SIO1G2]